MACSWRKTTTLKKHSRYSQFSACVVFVGFLFFFSFLMEKRLLCFCVVHNLFICVLLSVFVPFFCLCQMQCMLLCQVQLVCVFLSVSHIVCSLVPTVFVPYLCQVQPVCVTFLFVSVSNTNCYMVECLCQSEFACRNCCVQSAVFVFFLSPIGQT